MRTYKALVYIQITYSLPSASSATLLFFFPLLVRKQQPTMNRTTAIKIGATMATTVAVDSLLFPAQIPSYDYLVIAKIHCALPNGLVTC